MDSSLKILNTHFGYPTFKPFQKQAVDLVLQQKDCIITAQTGMGKTEIWCISHLMLEKHTLVITPTVALNQNLEQRLKTLTHPPDVVCFSNLHSKERQTSIQHLEKSEKCIILSTPEQILLPELKRCLEKLYRDGKIGRVVYDEIHTLIDWGYSFRVNQEQSALFLAALRRTLQDPSEIPFICLTATLPPKHRKDVTKTLNLGADTLYLDILPNPAPSTWQVIRMKGVHCLPNRQSAILDQIRQDHAGRVKGIVFTPQKQAETVANFLTENGIPSLAYTSKTSSKSKEMVMTSWNSDSIRFIVGTSSIGAGLNLPDVQTIIHSSKPFSALDILQKSGRCCREAGISGTVHFLVNPSFLAPQYYDGPIMRKPFWDEDQESVNYFLFQDVRCRQQLAYFMIGTQRIDTCNKCDVCKMVQTTGTPCVKNIGHSVLPMLQSLAAKPEGLTRSEIINKIGDNSKLSELSRDIFSWESFFKLIEDGYLRSLITFEVTEHKERFNLTDAGINIVTSWQGDFDFFGQVMFRNSWSKVLRTLPDTESAFNFD